MITLTASMKIESENPLPFVLGSSALGSVSLFGEKIDVEAIFDRRNLLSLEGEIIDRGDIQLPSWGIISNGGSLSFKDKNFRFYNYANAGILKEGIKVELFLNNTLSKSKNQVGTYYTSKWEYDNDNNSVSVSLKDDLEEWQDINVYGIDYDPRNPESKTMDFFYNYLHGKTPEKYNMLSFGELDDKTSTILKLTTIKYPLMGSGNLWEQWVKLCECCALYIYKNKNARTVCEYSNGS